MVQLPTRWLVKVLRAAHNAPLDGTVRNPRLTAHNVLLGDLQNRAPPSAEYVPDIIAFLPLLEPTTLPTAVDPSGLRTWTSLPASPAPLARNPALIEVYATRARLVRLVRTAYSA